MSTAPLLVIEDLHATTTQAAPQPCTEVLDGVSLTIEEGEIHLLFGPEGSGAAALGRILLGSPDHEVTSGRILFQGDDITAWDTDVRAKAGLFLAFQDPQQVAGVSLLSLLQQAIGARRGAETSVLELRLALTEWMERLGIDRPAIEGSADQGRSTGDTHHSEVLQMALLEPELVILDETGPTPGAQAASTLAAGVQTVRAERPSLGTLAITHRRRLLDHLHPDQVHVLVGARVVASGGPELADQLETEGYESFT